ncbi:MAG: hypothetical protein K6F05_06220 [Succinivibrio sp.]|nr:hypothetical protein [Succinivibrio sp.]
MAVSKQDYALMQEVADFYQSTIDPVMAPSGSIRRTAQKFKLTRCKVIKMLVTKGLYQSEEAAKVQQLRSQGLSVREIAERLDFSEATVSSYLPYTKVIHATSEPCAHTQAVREYRAYEKQLVQRALNRQSELAASAQSAHEEAESEEIPLMPSACYLPDDFNHPKAGLKLSRKKGAYLLPEGLIRVHVRLNHIDKRTEQILKDYGGVRFGRTVTRDLLISPLMPLRSLHYVLQRAFGFLNGHLHRFELSHEDLKSLTHNRMANLLKLCGSVVTYDDGRMYRDDPVYLGGSFKRWLKAQYSKPYIYYGDHLFEHFELVNHGGRKKLLQRSEYDLESSYYKLSFVHKTLAKETLQRLNVRLMPDDFLIEAEDFAPLPGTGEWVRFVLPENSDLHQELAYCQDDDPLAMRYRKVKLKGLSLEDGLRVLYDAGPDKLIERLCVSEVLALAKDYLPYDDRGRPVHAVTGLCKDIIPDDETLIRRLRLFRDVKLRPFCDSLIYRYDYGDGWTFTLTGSQGCSDLIEDGRVSQSTFDKAVHKALTENLPVLLCHDGDMLIEDVGGIDGFTDFLVRLNLDPHKVIYQSYDYLEPQMYTDLYQNPEAAADGAKAQIFERAEDDHDYLSASDYDLSDAEKTEQSENSTDNQTGSLQQNRYADISRAELLDFAISRGWQRNATQDLNLL